MCLKRIKSAKEGVKKRGGRTKIKKEKKEKCNCNECGLHLLLRSCITKKAWNTKSSCRLLLMLSSTTYINKAIHHFALDYLDAVAIFKYIIINKMCRKITIINVMLWTT